MGVSMFLPAPGPVQVTDERLDMLSVWRGDLPDHAHAFGNLPPVASGLPEEIPPAVRDSFRQAGRNPAVPEFIPALTGELSGFLPRPYRDVPPGGCSPPRTEEDPPNAARSR